MRRISFCAIAGAVALAAQSANASVLLSDLAGKTYNPSDPTTYIQVGDKVFTNFGYAATGDMPAGSQVNVLPIIDSNGYPGLRFQGAFQDLPGNGASDALVTYSVIVVDPNFRISDAHLGGNPSIFIDPAGGTTGSLTVTETWLPQGGNAKVGIWDIQPGTTSLQGSVDFPAPYFTTIQVQKDILADSGPLLDAVGKLSSTRANMSFVDQTYSQTPVPEPASLGLLGIGGAALLFRRKKA